MSWIGWTLLFVVVLSVIGSLNSKNLRGTKSSRRQKRGGSRARNIQAEAEEIGSRISTEKQYRALEARVEDAADRMLESESGRAYDNASHKHSVLQTALDIAGRKNLGWQLIPNFDLHTPKHILEQLLEHSYKVYSEKEYNELKDSLPKGWSCWRKLTLWNEPEEPAPSLARLKDFRAIVESDLTQEQMTEQINELTSHEHEFFELFFSHPAMQHGEEWFAERLEREGLPLAYKLYREGYTTPEKCLEIDPYEFLKRKGVGPKTVEKLKQFQAKTKQTLIGPGDD